MKDTRPDIKGVMESSLIFLENQERTLEVVAPVRNQLNTYLYIYTHTHYEVVSSLFWLNNDS